MKVGIVGAGAAETACMFAMAPRGSAREIVLVNRTHERARGAVADRITQQVRSGAAALLPKVWFMRRVRPGAGDRRWPPTPPAAVYLRTGEIMAPPRKQSANAPTPDEERAERTEERKAAPRQGRRQPRPYPDLVDDTLDDSFPASDPPSWAGK